MTTKVLLIGGCHLYGYGLNAEQHSFVDVFVHRLKETGQSPQLTSHVFVPLANIRHKLAQLDPHQYDIIVIQPAHYELQHPASFWQLFTPKKRTVSEKVRIESQTDDLTSLRSQPIEQPRHTPPSSVKRMKNMFKCGLLRVGSRLGLVKQLISVRRELRLLLTHLQAYQQQTIVLTPIAHRESVSHWLRQQGRKTLVDEGHRQGLTILDTHVLIHPDERLYLTGDAGHLNATGHKLLGEALFSCYQAKISSVEDSINGQNRNIPSEGAQHSHLDLALHY